MSPVCHSEQAALGMRQRHGLMETCLIIFYQVNKSRNLSVENFLRLRSVRRLGALGGYVSGFRQSKSQPPAFFQTNHGRGLTCRQRLAGVQIGGLDWNVDATDVDRGQSQADIASVGLHLGCTDRLD